MRGLPVGAGRATGYLPPAKFSGESEFSIRFKIWDRDHAEIQDSNTKSASDSNKNQLIFVFESLIPA